MAKSKIMYSQTLNTKNQPLQLKNNINRHRRITQRGACPKEQFIKNKNLHK
jgi:hypothetical protein